MRDDPTWKQKIRERVDVDRSPQTVGRRVDALEADGYLASCIIKADDHPRTLTKAYQLTEKGREQINGN